MKKLRFETGAAMVARNAEQAESKGCDMLDTNAWWGTHKDEKSFYLEIPNSDMDELTQEEQELLED
jgi:hypothetical protein